MNDYRPLDDDALDALVRAHLEYQSRGVGPLVERVLARLDTVIPSSRHPVIPSRLRYWSLWFAAAAAVVVAVFGGYYTAPSPASAAALVSAAREEHARPVDRCYRIDVVPGGPLEHLPFRLSPRDARLWTRGDRFWIASATERGAVAWGRDEHGRVWVALARNLGLRFERDEVPEPLAQACDVRGVRLETLLQDVLADFELHPEAPATETPAGVVRLRAEWKPGRFNSRLRSAVLEIDPRTKEVRRLILNRFLGTVTLTLTETATRPAAEYELEGHLDAGAAVHERAQPAFEKD